MSEDGSAVRVFHIANARTSVAYYTGGVMAIFMFNVRARLSHYRTIFRRPALAIIAFLFATLSGLAFLRDEFLPDEWQRRLKMPHLLPSWSWEIWLILALIVALIGAMEGSFRLHRSIAGLELHKNRLVSDISLFRNFSGPEPIQINFRVSKNIKNLIVILEYRHFVNGSLWTAPRAIILGKFDYVIRHKQIHMPLIEIDEKFGAKWGPVATNIRDPITDLINTGRYKVCLQFIGDKKVDIQTYYFMCDIFKNNAGYQIEITPQEDFLFINEWERRTLKYPPI